MPSAETNTRPTAIALLICENGVEVHLFRGFAGRRVLALYPNGKRQAPVDWIRLGAGHYDPATRIRDSIRIKGIAGIDCAVGPARLCRAVRAPKCNVAFRLNVVGARQYYLVVVERAV